MNFYGSPTKQGTIYFHVSGTADDPERPVVGGARPNRHRNPPRTVARPSQDVVQPPQPHQPPPPRDIAQSLDSGTGAALTFFDPHGVRVEATGRASALRARLLKVQRALARKMQP